MTPDSPAKGPKDRTNDVYNNSHRGEDQLIQDQVKRFSRPRSHRTWPGSLRLYDRVWLSRTVNRTEKSMRNISLFCLRVFIPSDPCWQLACLLESVICADTLIRTTVIIIIIILIIIRIIISSIIISGSINNCNAFVGTLSS